MLEHPDDIKKDNFGKWQHSGSHGPTDVYSAAIYIHRKCVLQVIMLLCFVISTVFILLLHNKFKKTECFAFWWHVYYTPGVVQIFAASRTTRLFWCLLPQGCFGNTYYHKVVLVMFTTTLISSVRVASLFLVSSFYFRVYIILYI